MARKQAAAEPKRMTLADIQAQLARAGYKLTRPRLLVAQSLLNSSGHPSAQELGDRLRDQDKRIGLTSVYRTLDLLTRLGVVRRLQFGQDSYRYELIAPEHHHHVVCNACGKVEIIERQELEQVLDAAQRSVEQEMAFEIGYHWLEFFGRCAACAAGEPPAPLPRVTP